MESKTFLLQLTQAAWLMAFLQPTPNLGEVRAFSAIEILKKSI